MTNIPWFGAWAPNNLTQNINPWDVTWSPNGQYGLINVSMKTSTPQLERDIVGNVASYGKQIGRANELLAVLLHHVHLPQLTAVEHKAIEDFQIMMAEIAAIKEGY